MASRPRVRAVTPLLVVADLQRALDFYLQKLGFVEPRVHGEPPCFAMLNRDGFDMMLSLAGAQSNARPNGPDGTWDVYVSIADVAAEIEALRALGVEIARGPTDMPYAMREIEVLDPDGHRICLAQDIGEERWRVAERWEGTLDLGARHLRLVLKIAPSGGQLAARLDSLDQGAHDLEVDGIQREGVKLSFEMRAIGASYSGELTPSGSELRGTWSQRGASFPLAFRRV